MEEKNPDKINDFQIETDDDLIRYLNLKREKELERHNNNIKSQLKNVLSNILNRFYPDKNKLNKKVTFLIEKYDSLYLIYQNESKVLRKVWEECKKIFSKAILPPDSINIDNKNE